MFFDAIKVAPRGLILQFHKLAHGIFLEERNVKFVLSQGESGYVEEKPVSEDANSLSRRTTSPRSCSRDKKLAQKPKTVAKTDMTSGSIDTLISLESSKKSFLLVNFPTSLKKQKAPNSTDLQENDLTETLFDVFDQKCSGLKAQLQLVVTDRKTCQSKADIFHLHDPDLDSATAERHSEEAI